MSTSIERLLILGCGYVGTRLARRAMDAGIHVLATTRSESRASTLRGFGIEAVVVASPDRLAEAQLDSVDAVLDSIPLTRDEHGMHASQSEWLPHLAPRLPHLRWAGYLSTTGVYGDAGGAWVDEEHPCDPSSARGQQRLLAEQEWLASALPAEVFRIAGIYGPERNILARLMSGDYRAVRWQPPHWSNRIHVDDIVAALQAAMARPRAGRIVNLADDCPLPHDEYVTELAGMIGAAKPVILTPAEGEAQLSATALDFFRDNKRISNRRLHAELLPALKYPSFREAVATLQETSPTG